MIQTLSDLKTVRFNEQADGVIILDQTLLPGKEAYLTLTTAEEIWDAIYKLKVRGAPAIGIAAAYGIYVCARRIDTAEKSVFVDEFRKIKEYLAGNLCRCSGFVGQTRSILKYLEYKKNQEKEVQA